jgi:uncharacterized membrane protein YccC
VTLPTKRSSGPKISAAVIHSVALALSSLLTYWIVTSSLKNVYFVSHSDDLLGGMWAVVATLFVYRCSYQQRFSVAIQRMAATIDSFILCFVYLLLTRFHPWGLALLIGIGALVMMLIGRPDDVVTTSITTAVVMVVAALSSRSPWEQPVLRLLDTAVGMAVGLVGAWLALRIAPRLRGHTGDFNAESTR